MQTILVIGFSQAFILGALILFKKSRNLSDCFLSGMFFLNGLTLLLGYMEIYNRQNDYPFPFFINSSTPWILLHGPALWFYIKSLTKQRFILKPLYILHFIPFVLVSGMMAMGIYILPAEQRIYIDSTESFKNDIAFPLVIAMIAVSNLAYYIWGIKLVAGYNSLLKSYFSEISRIDLKWLKFLLISGICFYATISLFYIVDYMFELLSYNVLQLAGFSFAAIFVLVLGFYGNKQGNIFHSNVIKLEMEKSSEIKFSDSPLEETEREFVNKLLSFMKKERPFLNPELNIATLSKELGVSTEYLSEILNNRLNRNFFDFVNHYRIEEFKNRCRKPENNRLTIMGIAYDSGFNSKATFNRVFKKVTGTTPGEFQKGT